MEIYKLTRAEFLTEIFKCFDVEPCEENLRFIIKELSADAAVKIVCSKGYYNHEAAMKKIGNKVVKKWPKLSVVLNQLVDEGSCYGFLCAYIIDFMESIAWLSGNRAWPVSYGIFVKRIQSKDFGILVDRTIKSSDSDHQWNYDDYFQMAMDGWKVD
jgi:hypothetical protein